MLCNLLPLKGFLISGKEHRAIRFSKTINSVLSIEHSTECYNSMKSAMHLKFIAEATFCPPDLLLRTHGEPINFFTKYLPSKESCAQISIYSASETSLIIKLCAKLSWRTLAKCFFSDLIENWILHIDAAF